MVNDEGIIWGINYEKAGGVLAAPGANTLRVRRWVTRYHAAPRLGRGTLCAFHTRPAPNRLRHNERPAAQLQRRQRGAGRANGVRIAWPLHLGSAIVWIVTWGPTGWAHRKHSSSWVNRLLKNARASAPPAAALLECDGVAQRERG